MKKEAKTFYPFVFAALLLVGFAIRFGLAQAFPNLFRADEIFQTLEPAHRLYDGWGVVAWEWREGIRSWLLPALLSLPMFAAGAMGRGAAFYLPLTTALLSLMSLACIAAAWHAGRAREGLTGALLCGLLAALWPDMVFFAAKPLTEVQAGTALLLAIVLAETGPLSRRRLATVGALLALAFWLRFHLAPALVVAAAMTARADLRRWLALAAGAAIPLAAMGVLDTLTLGTPFQSVWKNFFININENRSEIYGTEPMLWFVAEFVRSWGAAILPLAAAFLYGAPAMPIAAATAVMIVLSHSLIPHKQYSFIYSAIPLALLVAGIGTARFVRALPALLRPAIAPRTLSLAALATWLLICLTTSVSGDFPTRWRYWADDLRMMAAIRDRAPQLCGLALFGEGALPYAVIDAHLPMQLVRTADALAAVRPSVNAILASRDRVPFVPDATPDTCWGDTCLLRTRQAACTPVPGYDVNTELAREGR